MEHSSLYRLSPEIRNSIYEYVFASDYAVTLQDNAIAHSLTKTCRGIRQETHLLFFSMTKFNAHLDDGPLAPVAKLLQVLGPEVVLATEEINIWDLHMLNVSLHGTQSTKQLLGCKPVEGESYVLRPIEIETMRHSGDSLYVQDLAAALDQMGLAVRRFCVLGPSGDVVKNTSRFAIIQPETTGAATDLGNHS